VIVSGIGVGVYFLVSHKNDKNSARGNTKDADPAVTDPGPKAPVPAGWVLHNAANSKFRVYLPKPPSTTKTSSFNGVSIDMVASAGPRDRLAASVVGLFIPPGTPGANRGQLYERMRQGILQTQGAVRPVSKRSVTWVGRPATETTLESNNKAARVVMREVSTTNGIYFAFFACSTGPSPDEEKGFFDNFELIE
jgi:hypothetical protein